MRRVRPLAGLFLVLALLGCAQRPTGQAQASHPPHSPEDKGIKTINQPGQWVGAAWLRPKQTT